LGVIVAIRELGMEEIDLPVSYIGSVFDSGELIVRPFAEAIMAKCPRARVLPPKFPSVVGAFVLGAKEIGWPISGEMLMNIKKSLLLQ
jgi:hypothetical protein